MNGIAEEINHAFGSTSQVGLVHHAPVIVTAHLKVLEMVA